MGIEYFWKPVFVYESVVKILLLRRRRLVAIHPANSEDPMRDQQVMLAQDAGPGILEGEDRGPDYARDQMPNGVDRQVRLDPSPISLESLQWGSPVNLQGPVGAPASSAEAATLQLPVPRPTEETSGLEEPGANSRATTSTGGMGEWPPALGWMSRLNDFFQRAATGSVEMITTHASQQVTGSRDGGLMVQQRTYRTQQAVSPPRRGGPQELPQRERPLDPPLFGAEAQRAMEEWPLQAPLLHGQPRPPVAVTEGSDRASSTSIPRELVQEEVKRQVVEAMRAQNEHLERLQRENEVLRAMQMPPPGLSQGRLHQGQIMNEEDRALGQALPQGDRALGQALPQGDRALGPALPQGDRALGPALPQGDRALGPALPQGDRALGPALPQGDRALGQALPQGDRALGQALPQGDRVLGQYGVSQDEDLPGQHEARPGGVRFDEYAREGDPAERAHPFRGLLQGDAVRASSSLVPPPQPSPTGPTRGDYGARAARTRSNSRERRAQEIPKAPQPPPRPRASTPSPTSPLETLVAGMAQIQQVLLKGKDNNDSSEYDPSKAVAEFPKLPDNSPESGAIDFQDWLYLVEQQVGSLASGASLWWAGMLDAAMKAYGRYQSATPIQRLAVASELSPEWEDVKFSKLEKRVAALMLGSLPQAMKEEMVAYRVRRVHQQLFRLLVNYQPGGSTDRALVLAQLEQKDGGTDPSEVVAALRRWYRWLQRAQDLQLSLPDPSVQIRSLTALTKKLAERNADLQFKIALAKTELRVESRPTQDTALRFFQHLLAEIEQLGPAKAQRTPSTTTTTPTTTGAEARVKGAQVTPKSQPTSPKGEGKGQGCKWFTSDQGCARGRGCRFVHDWTQVVKSERCLVCGSKQHKVKDCPRKDIEPVGEGPSVKGLNKKELKVAQATSSTTQPTPTPPAQSVPNVDTMTPAAKGRCRSSSTTSFQ